MANRIRVLVVDDSSVQRQMLVALLSHDPELEVVGTADSGERAIAQAAKLQPDVITMDLRMPGMDGLVASEAIIARQPVPILMVTASASRDDQRLIARAFNAGILAVVAKPSLNAVEDHDEFRRMVKGVSRVKLVRRRPTSSHAPSSVRAAPMVLPPSPAPFPSEQRRQPRLSLAAMPAQIRRLEIVGIAASTGGPQVLASLLKTLPARYPLPVLIVQHIASGFAGSLADWLEPQCRLPVRLAEPGARLERGVWLAHGKHLTVKNDRLGVSLEPPVSGHNPSGTVLFNAMATEYPNAALGIILTGMGEDGARGLKNLRAAGGVTVAQDANSSVIHGMPGAAIAIDAADFVLSPDDIARAMLEFARRGRALEDWE
jgi:two-component system chemotaxis response regulator CheB